jgi:hypothetical protein
MKTKVTLLLAAGLLIGLCASTGVAQTEEPASELYAIWEMVVNPSKVDQYEENQKEWAILYKDHPYKWWVTSTDDLHYHYGFLLKDFSDADALFKAFEEHYQKLGARAEELERSGAGTVVSTHAAMWRLNNQLSYAPENPRLKEEEIDFFRLHYLYFQGGTEAKAAEIFKKWKDLYARKNVPDAYSVWVGGFGTDEPVYIVVFSGKNAADYYTQSGERRKLLGGEQDALWQETSAIIRKMERKNGRPRPELATVSSTAPTTEN